MRASVQHTYVHRGPWIDSDDVALNRAIVFATKYTTFDVHAAVTNDLRRTMKKTHGQLWTAGQDDIKILVKKHFQLNENETDRMGWLQQRHCCLYLDANMNPTDMFNTELVSEVLALMYFETSQKIGFIFMDRLLQDDDPVELGNLLQYVA
ncbi:hypothetical protein FRC06_006182 [Ceratobasidium sp. 370]|nr:hypothetical protein FRC06_006182 [Ceratobasidium sp. 370]